MVINDRQIRQRRELMSHGEVFTVLKEGITGKVTFEKRPERNEGASHADILFFFFFFFFFLSFLEPHPWHMEVQARG